MSTICIVLAIGHCLASCFGLRNALYSAAYIFYLLPSQHPATARSGPSSRTQCPNPPERPGRKIIRQIGRWVIWMPAAGTQLMLLPRSQWVYRTVWTAAD